MPIFYRYRLRCTTDNEWKFINVPVEDPAPTECPDDSGHAIDADATCIANVIEALEKEGAATFSSEASKAITYPVSYDTETLSILLTPTANINCWVSDITKNGFTLNLSTSYTGDIYWSARGY